VAVQYQYSVSAVSVQCQYSVSTVSAVQIQGQCSVSKVSLTREEAVFPGHHPVCEDDVHSRLPTHLILITIYLLSLCLLTLYSRTGPLSHVLMCM
jgi:hypothetical protein